MADGVIRIAPDSTGKDTHTENFAPVGGTTLHVPRYQRVVGPPAYVGSVIGSAVGASKNHAGLFNAVGGPNLRLWRIQVIPHLTVAIAGLAVTMYLLRTSAAGAGAAGNKTLADPNSAASSGSVSLLGAFTTQPTVTANSFLDAMTVNNEETVAQSGKVDLFNAWSDAGDPFIVRPGTGLVVQQSALLGAGAFSLLFRWTEA